MTAAECVYTTRMLIDDGRDWFPTTAFLVETLNYAQYQVIHQLFQAQDERGLRPLHQETLWLRNGDPITRTVGANRLTCLYPRGVRIVADPTALIIPTTPISGNMITGTSKYLDNNNFYNYALPNYNVYTDYPRMSYYTITYSYNPGLDKQIAFLQFTSPTNTIMLYEAKLVYIEEPQLFTYTKTPASDTTLSLPREYHYKVCSEAAEMINTTDVGEMERSLIAFQNQKLTYSSVGGLQ